MPQFSADTTDLPPFIAARRLPGYAAKLGQRGRETMGQATVQVQTLRGESSKDQDQR